MKQYKIFILGFLAAASCIAGSFNQEETIQKEFQISKPDADFTVIVDNVWGAIHLKGTSGNTVKAIIHKKIEARSESQFQQAIQEVTLDISEENSLLEFFVDGPFRDRHNGRDHDGWHHRKYKVLYEFDLEVPRDLSIDIKTVNDGDITIDNIRGNYEVNNVNGEITMTGLRGSGKGYTVNGDLICYFDQNPKEDCNFGTINGDVKLYFQNPLSAQFAMKTFNGDAYSDFELTHVASDPEIIKETNGRTRYKSVHRYCATAGHGGPLIKWDGFNGNLLILKYHKGEQS